MVFLGFFFSWSPLFKENFEYKKAAFKTIWWPDRDLRKLPKWILSKHGENKLTHSQRDGRAPWQTTGQKTPSQIPPGAGKNVIWNNFLAIKSRHNTAANVSFLCCVYFRTRLPWLCRLCILWVDSTVCFLAHDPCHHNTPPTRLTKRKASVFFCYKLPTAGDFKMCSAWASDGVNYAFVCSTETTRLTPLLHAEVVWHLW